MKSSQNFCLNGNVWSRPILLYHKTSCAYTVMKETFETFWRWLIKIQQSVTDFGHALEMTSRTHRGVPHIIHSRKGVYRSRYRIAKRIQHQIRAPHRRLVKFVRCFSGLVWILRVTLGTILATNPHTQVKSGPETVTVCPTGRFHIRNSQINRNNP